MKVLVLGSGAREHALAWKIASSRRLSRLYSLPGNPGLSELGELLPGDPEDIEAVAATAARLGIDLTVVGPEGPLVKGIADGFRRRGLRLFGPTAAAARLEGSKIFSRRLLARLGVPGPAYAVFDDPAAAFVYVERHGRPVAVKADGLAAGKGVLIAREVEAARAAVTCCMVDQVHGAAGSRVVIEELLSGEEVSALALVDGRRAWQLPSARDYKRVGDGDQGPNTGGMGACSPWPAYTPELAVQVQTAVFDPVVRAMDQEGATFQGVLYAGLMLTPDGPKVLEFNVRLGDPEAQVILPRLEGDFLDLLEAALDGRLDQVNLAVRPGACVSVVLASPGYPGAYPRGLPITGVDRAAALPGVMIFQGGTARDPDGRLVTAGGRVLAVTALGDTLDGAAALAYEAAAHIAFPGMQFRRDIAGPVAGERS
ncbi:MAG TPA: phosphoribosylamine--glycine ligase [Clostridiales bacterium]|nr:phosphoribosylamine--glycine ligase [Clostridiales bacterium]